MTKTLIITALVAGAVLAGAEPAAALSCAPPNSFNLADVVLEARVAAVGTITSISSSNEEEWGDAELLLTVEVSEVYKGVVPRWLRLHRDTTVWGPFYEEGQEIALVQQGGVMQDGQQELCGPWFTADELRDTARAVGLEAAAPEAPGGFLSAFLAAVMAILRGLFG